MNNKRARNIAQNYKVTKALRLGGREFGESKSQCLGELEVCRGLVCLRVCKRLQVQRG